MAAKQSHECLYTDKPIQVDGVLDEPAWQRAAPLTFVVPVTLAEPISKTDARVLWDEEYLYVGFKAYDKDIWSYLTERDSTTCSEDVLEIFFKPDEQNDAYYNFEINAIGTVLGAFGIDRNKRFHLADSLLTQIDTTPSLERKPIESLEQRTFWSMRLIIPVRIFHFSNIKTLSGVDAQANFYKCGDKLKQPHFLSWKPVLTSTPDFHTPKYFGQLYFI